MSERTNEGPSISEPWQVPFKIDRGPRNPARTTSSRKTIKNVTRCKPNGNIYLVVSKRTLRVHVYTYTYTYIYKGILINRKRT